jgi:hypothetical protein
VESGRAPISLPWRTAPAMSMHATICPTRSAGQAPTRKPWRVLKAHRACREIKDKAASKWCNQPSVVGPTTYGITVVVTEKLEGYWLLHCPRISSWLVTLLEE